MKDLIAYLDNIIKHTKSDAIKWNSDSMYKYIGTIGDCIITVFDATYNSEDFDPYIVVTIALTNDHSHALQVLKVPQYTAEYDKLKELYILLMNRGMAEYFEKFIDILDAGGTLPDKYKSIGDEVTE